ncbi:MAG TPA: SpoIVB peptidase S55 domain-containing protein [Actinomycetota bacterium]|nr:SpoIVB peptidase S55 domain-containing protein [Actinomycetota bacterium]
MSDRRRTRLSPALSALFGAALIVTALPAGAGPGPIDCPAPKPVGELTVGMTGTGWTVSTGTDPEPFDAEVLGVLKDGVAPGRDMIVVETSSPAISDAGGVWQGMSGSPVYVDDELIGVVAYSLATGPSMVAGLTTAKDLFNLAGYPTESAARSSAGAYTKPSQIRSSSGANVGNADNYRVLRLPLQISGVTPRAVNRLSKTLRREKAPFTAYAGSSSAPSFGPPTATVGAGDSFAATLSYGDVTFATIGTTSLVCGDNAVAFGHPVNWTGRTEMGANAATTVGIVDDSAVGPYKLAKVKGAAGVVDQDRLAGVRARLTEVPEIAPVVAEVSAANTGITQKGKSFAVLDKVVPSLAFYHLIGHMDSTFDQISGGSSEITFKIKGMAGGTPFEVNRTNEFSTHEDISIASSHELERSLWTLLTQPFEEVHFTKVRVEASLSEEQVSYKLRRVRISKNGGKFRGVRELKVKGGDKLDLRARVMDIDREIQKIDLSLKVPRGARGNGSITIAGSASDVFEDGGLSCFFVGDICKANLPRGVDSFDEVLDFLESRDTNSILRAELQVGRRTEDSDKVNLDAPVSGFDYVSLNLPGGRGNPHFER